MKRFDGLNGPALRVWGLATLLAMVVFLLTRGALLVHSVLASQQTMGSLLAALALGGLRDLPVAALIASPWAFFALLFSARWRDRLGWPLFATYVFTLLFVAVSEGIFWDEFSVRFNFIALDYLVFTTEVIGNIRQSYPVGKIVAGLLALTLFVVWGLRRTVRRSLAADGARRNPVGRGGPLAVAHGAIRRGARARAGGGRRKAEGRRRRVQPQRWHAVSGRDVRQTRWRGRDLQPGPDSPTLGGLAQRRRGRCRQVFRNRSNPQRLPDAEVW